MKYRPIFFRSTSALLATSMFFVAQLAAAQDIPDGQCASDADCPERGECQKAQWVDGCSAPEQGEAPTCDNTVHEAEFGTCYVPPPECQSNDDCEEYTSCQESGGSRSCVGDSSGTISCSEPEEGPSYCAPEYVSSCETNADCPREFECVSAPTACPTIDCAEGTQCEPCKPSKVKQCEPVAIDCEKDDVCPSGWSCVDTVSYECSGSSGGGTVEPDLPPPDGDSADSGGGADDAPADGLDGGSGDSPTGDGPSGDGATGGEDRPDEGDVKEECREVPQVGYCMPDAWIGSEGAIRGDADASGAPALDGEGSANSDDPKTAGADDLSSEEGDGASESGGGCSVATGVPGGGGAAWLLAFLGLIPFWRRRRSRRNVVA